MDAELGVAKAKRPPEIVIICILGLYFAIEPILAALFPDTALALWRNYSVQVFVLTSIIGAVDAVAYVGCFLMKKWGVYVFVVARVFAWLAGIFLLDSFVNGISLFTVLALVIFLFRFKQMR